jgi:hypothetical protein
MTTFWLSFGDPTEDDYDKLFLGVAIFDMDEGDGELDVSTIVSEAHRLGINPGGEVRIQEITQDIPAKYKGVLIKDEKVLIRLGLDRLAARHRRAPTNRGR